MRFAIPEISPPILIDPSGSGSPSRRIYGDQYWTDLERVARGLVVMHEAPEGGSR